VKTGGERGASGGGIIYSEKPNVIFWAKKGRFPLGENFFGISPQGDVKGEKRERICIANLKGLIIELQRGELGEMVLIFGKSIFTSEMHSM